MRNTFAAQFLIAVFCMVSVSNACVLPVKSAITDPSDIFPLINLPQTVQSDNILNLISDYLSTILGGNGSVVKKPEMQIPDFVRIRNQNRNFKRHGGYTPVISETSVSHRFHWKHSTGNFHHNFDFCTDSKAVPENKPSVLVSFGAFALIALGFIRKQKKPSE